MRREASAAAPFSIPSAAATRGSHQWTSWGAAVFLLTSTWLGVNAAWGLTGSSDMLISSWEQQLMPLGDWVVSTLVLLTIVALGVIRRRQDLFRLTSLLLAYYN